MLERHYRGWGILVLALSGCSQDDQVIGPSASILAFAAAPVVDQIQAIGTEQNQAICCAAHFYPIARGQTFTAGRTGLLAGLELSLFTSGGPADLQVDILDQQGGDPRSAPVLGSVAVSPANVGPLAPILDPANITATYIDLTALGIPVQRGQPLAFRLRSAADLPALWAIQTSVFTDRYAGGSYFAITPDNTIEYSGDAAFKTFVIEANPLDVIRQEIAASLLTVGEKRSLTAKLAALERSLDSGNCGGSVGPVSAFLNELKALEQTGRLDHASTQAWGGAVRELVGSCAGPGGTW